MKTFLVTALAVSVLAFGSSGASAAKRSEARVLAGQRARRAEKPTTLQRYESKALAAQFRGEKVQAQVDNAMRAEFDKMLRRMPYDAALSTRTARQAERPMRVEPALLRTTPVSKPDAALSAKVARLQAQVDSLAAHLAALERRLRPADGSPQPFHSKRPTALDPGANTLPDGADRSR